MNAFALIDKPRGITSFDVVARVRRVVRVRSVGHTGTLDPMATGLLIVAIGEATKLIPVFDDDEKTYVAEVRLGVTTDTGDADGKATAEAPIPEISEARIAALQGRFTGETLQTPPMYSALKQDGKRLYELAREGKEVARDARKVTVHELELSVVDACNLRMRARVSKGTYIRALATDMGAALGCGAHLTALRRVAAGFSTLDDAQSLEAFQAAPRLLEPAAVVRRYAHIRITDRQLADIRHGRALRADSVILEGATPRTRRIIMLGPLNTVIGLAELVPGRGLQPRRLLHVE